MTRFLLTALFLATAFFLEVGTNVLWAGTDEYAAVSTQPSILMAAAAEKKAASTSTKGLKRPALKPDLVVSTIQLTPDCRIKVTIKNKGAGAVPQAAYHRTNGAAVQATAKGAGWGGYRLFMVDPSRKLMKPGASVSYVGFKRALAPGEILTLKVAVQDAKNTLNESNRTNNSLTRRLTCAAKPGRATKQTSQLGRQDTPHAMRLKPDLTIKTMKIFPASPTTLDNIRFSAFVHNAGAATAGASKVGIKIGGETFPMLFNKPAITAGSSNAIVRLKKLERPGTYWVKFIADVNNDVSESNESNNMDSLKFTVVEPAPPDLTVTNITNDANNCLLYTVKNLGGPIPSTVNRSLIGIRFTKGGIIGYTVTNLNLMDPNCVLCQTNGTITASKCHPGQNSGPWFDCIQAKVEVDYTNKLAETNETNNSMEDNALDCGGPPWN
jgi:hypothetical protein